MWVGAIVHGHHRNPPVGDERIPSRVLRIARHPWAINIAHARNAAGEPEIVNHLAALFIDVLVDQVDERLRTLVDPDPRIVRRG